MSLTLQEREQIRAREQAATKGPWGDGALRGVNIFAGNMNICDIRGWGHLTGSGGLRLSDDEAIRVQVANATFIAQARQDIPALLDELNAKDAELARIAADKAYLFQANVANEWEERYQCQERRIELKDAEIAERDATIAAMREEVHALHQERKGEVWFWQDDEEDHLESLTCPVLIAAAVLRKLVVENADLRMAAIPYRTHSDESWRRKVERLEKRIQTLESDEGTIAARYTFLEKLAEPEGYNPLGGPGPEVFIAQRIERLTAELAEARHSQEVTEICAKANRQRAEAAEAALRETQNAVRNQRGDDLCWIQNPENAEVARALPEAEFLESCRRYRAQIASERGEFPAGKTIAQLEAECQRLKAEMYDLKAGIRLVQDSCMTGLTEAALDTARLDWLEGELAREQRAHAEQLPHVYSLFRANMPITREAIDAAMERPR